jgi:predicted MFS family arabinose efflux permease
VWQRARSGTPGQLIGGCAVGLSISWNIANVGSVATLLARRYGAGLAVIGLLTTVLFFAELVVMIPGGRAIDRHGAKRVGLAAMTLSLIGNLLLLSTSSLVLVLVWRGLAGLGVGLGFLSGAIYAQSDTGRAAPLAGGIYGGVSLGGGVPLLVGAFGWRAPYVGGALVAVLAIALVAACPPTPGHGGSRQTPLLRALIADRTLARLGTVSAVSFGFSVILGAWIVTLLERHAGLSRQSAGAIGSLILVLAIVGRPLGGILARARPSSTWPAVAASFLAGAAGTTLVALTPSPPLDALGAGVAGLAAGIPFGATLVGAARTHSEAAGVAVGAMNTYPVLAIVCGTPVVGLTFGLSGAGRIGFVGLAALWAAAVAAIPWQLDI